MTNHARQLTHCRGTNREWKLLLLVLLCAGVCYLSYVALSSMRPQVAPSRPESAATQNAQQSRGVGVSAQAAIDSEGMRQAFRSPAALTGTPSCNFSAFQEQLRLDTAIPVVPVHLLSGCTHVFNNRVPKTGSRTVCSIIRRMAEQHNFKQITGLEYNHKNHFTEHYMRVLVDELRRWNDRFCFSNHMHYYDFNQFFPHTAVYINVIRDPAEWFFSLYNFCKYETCSGERLKQLPDLTSCITRPTPSNVSARCTTLSYSQSPLHHLCGHGKECQQRSASSLSGATQRLHKDYLVVGLTDRLSEYFEVLEFLMPHMFSNSKSIYNNMTRELKTSTETKKKDEVDSETYKLLRQKLQLDYELYEAAVRRFQKLLNAVRYLKNHGTVY